jgi:hypothetical protein
MVCRVLRVLHVLHVLHLHPLSFRRYPTLSLTRFNWSSAQLFDMFDIKQNNVIEFGEFVRSLSVFHPHAPLADKAHCEQGENCAPVSASTCSHRRSYSALHVLS